MQTLTMVSLLENNTRTKRVAKWNEEMLSPADAGTANVLHLHAVARQASAALKLLLKWCGSVAPSLAKPLVSVDVALLEMEVGGWARS